MTVHAEWHHRSYRAIPDMRCIFNLRVGCYFHEMCARARIQPPLTLDPVGHLTDPPACRSRCPYSRPDMRRILSHPGNPIRTAISHPAKDSPASPGPARQDQSARSCHGPLAGLILAKREAVRGHHGQLAHRIMCRASSQRSASKPHGRDRPASYPAGYLPSTSRRPATPPGAGPTQRPSRRIRFCLYGGDRLLCRLGAATGMRNSQNDGSVACPSGMTLLSPSMWRRSRVTTLCACNTY
jgi:hypothetical protein